jgi:hypothetical protein
LKNIGKIIFDKFLNVLYAKENENENKVSPKKEKNNNNIWHYFQVIVNIKYFYNKSLMNK